MTQARSTKLLAAPTPQTRRTNYASKQFERSSNSLNSGGGKSSQSSGEQPRRASQHIRGDSRSSNPGSSSTSTKRALFRRTKDHDLEGSDGEGARFGMRTTSLRQLIAEKMKSERSVLPSIILAPSTNELSKRLPKGESVILATSGWIGNLSESTLANKLVPQCVCGVLLTNMRTLVLAMTGRGPLGEEKPEEFSLPHDVIGRMRTYSIPPEYRLEKVSNKALIVYYSDFRSYHLRFESTDAFEKFTDFVSNRVEDKPKKVKDALFTLYPRKSLSPVYTPSRELTRLGMSRSRYPASLLMDRLFDLMEVVGCTS